MLVTSRLPANSRHRTAKDPPATWAASQAGPREDNQDDYGRADNTVSGYPWREIGCLYVLADGMGGLQCGHEAARIAVEAVVAEFGRQRGKGDTSETIERAVEYANRKVLKYAEDRGVHTGCTIVACVLKDGVATVAHVGDSRLYHFSRGELKRCTLDHLYGTEILGATDDDEVKRGPQGHRISRALGQEPNVRVTVSEVEYSADDRFLLCSDGLSEAVEYSEIQAAITASTPRHVVQTLFAKAQNRLTDNATAIVVFASGRSIRMLRFARTAAMSLLAVLTLAGAALGGTLAWQAYLRPRFAARGFPANPASSTASAEELRVQAWIPALLSNGTSHAIYVWKDDDRSWRLALSPNEHARLEFGGEGNVWWHYQGDKAGRFRKRIAVDKAGSIRIGDDAGQIWANVTGDR